MQRRLLIASKPVHCLALQAEGLSLECRDMLSRLLVVDPEKARLW